LRGRRRLGLGFLRRLPRHPPSLPPLVARDGRRLVAASSVERKGAANPSKRSVRFAYQPPASSTFLSQQTSHQQPASSTLLSEQTSTSHQPPANRTG
jgi:hypothetical protein